MQSIINFLEQNTVFLPFLLIFIIILLIVFIVLLFRFNRKSQKQTIEAFQNAGQDIFENVSALLVKDLSNFAHNNLSLQVQSDYKQLIKEDLLPSVNTSAEILNNLAKRVTDRQESGMAELAEKLANIFTQKTEIYLKEEADVIFKMTDSAKNFSDSLLQVNQSISKFSNEYEGIFQKADTVSKSLAESAETINNGFLKFESVFEKSNQIFTVTQDSISKNAEIISSAASLTEEMREYVSDSVKTLSLSQKSTSQLLNNAVESMQKNTENAAEIVLSEFKSSLNINNEVLNETVIALQNVAAKMQETSADFSNGINTAFVGFNEVINDKTSEISNSIASTANEEYQKIIDGVNAYSKNFAQNIDTFSTAFMQQIDTLQTLTRHLNNNLASFKTDADASSLRFETGIEQIVTTALKEMDNSLAEIISRLISVAASIAEAADALPRAVNSIKNAK